MEAQADHWAPASPQPLSVVAVFLALPACSWSPAPSGLASAPSHRPRTWLFSVPCTLDSLSFTYINRHLLAPAVSSAGLQGWRDQRSP